MKKNKQSGWEQASIALNRWRATISPALNHTFSSDGKHFSAYLLVFMCCINLYQINS